QGAVRGDAGTGLRVVARAFAHRRGCLHCRGRDGLRPVPAPDPVVRLPVRRAPRRLLARDAVARRTPGPKARAARGDERRVRGQGGVRCADRLGLRHRAGRRGPRDPLRGDWARAGGPGRGPGDPGGAPPRWRAYADSHAALPGLHRPAGGPGPARGARGGDCGQRPHPDDGAAAVGIRAGVARHDRAVRASGPVGAGAAAARPGRRGGASHRNHPRAGGLGRGRRARVRLLSIARASPRDEEEFMNIGVVLPQTEIGNDPGAIKAYAEAVEDMGFTHILVFDHVLGANPERPGGWKGPYTYRHAFHEPFVLFGFLAAATRRLELVTGILILPQRQTALVAK